MLRPEENAQVTQVGPSTPMGAVMRRYWMPALLSRELPGPDSPPMRVKLLGESLVAFRDTNGRVGLIDEFCPHRRASLFLGRNEEAGLRCVYHGWKFDVGGACVDMPNEPAGSRFAEKIHITSYPVEEHAGVVWAYMGPADHKPELPDMEWTRAPATHQFVSVTHEYANYLQCVEGGIDTVHSSFLHNNDLSYKKGFRQLATAARLEITKTDYGFQYASIRDISEEEYYLRLYTFIMPFYQIRSRQIESQKGDADRREIPHLAGHMWVPIDDNNTLVYNWMCAADPDKPFNQPMIEATEANLGRGPDGETRTRHRTLANDWLIDRDMQREVNYTGIPGTNSQDLAVQESMGPIVDRSLEHLGTTDLAVITYRQILLDTIKTVANGGDPPGVDPKTYRDQRAADMVVSKSVNWRDAAAPELTARL